jgi:GNAT superfamily N-acetyltransferase
MFQIRAARETDIPELIKMAKVMHQESNFASLPFDEQVTTQSFRGSVRAYSGGVWLAVDNEHTIGFMAGQISRAMFSQEAVAQDQALYVHPSHRGKGVADRLLKQFCLWAAERGARRITVCNSAGAEDERFVRKLNHYGFKRAGSVMFMEV